MNSPQLKLRDIAKDLKVGDVFWTRNEVLELGDQDVPLEDRHFLLANSVMSSMIGGNTYGEAEVFLGDIDEEGAATKVVKQTTPLQIVKDEKAQGMVDAYEKILLSKKITIE